jgi:4,5-DOPA dioxygenase extradiol
MNDNNKTPSGSVLYISHGGGPLPLLGDGSHQELVENLKNIASVLTKPAAIVVISAHWEERQPTITSGESPSLMYDYYGFPKESYEIQYPAPGKPELAGKIFELLKKNGIEAALDERRGFDHGVFVPLKIMYPGADIPCVQISLVGNLSPIDHIQMGKALSELVSDNVLILGSGFSFHNMNAFFSPPTKETRAMNESFEQWLIDTCANQELEESERERRLKNWESAPAARFCHPREEHLLPLHVCYGSAQSPASQVFICEIMGIKASLYLW